MGELALKKKKIAVNPITIFEVGTAAIQNAKSYSITYNDFMGGGTLSVASAKITINSFYAVGNDLSIIVAPKGCKTMRASVSTDLGDFGSANIQINNGTTKDLPATGTNVYAEYTLPILDTTNDVTLHFRAFKGILYIKSIILEP